MEDGGGRWDTFNWRMISLDDVGNTLENVGIRGGTLGYVGERWDTWVRVTLGP